MPKKSRKRHVKNVGKSADACKAMVATLKEQLVTGDNFSETYAYFWDHLSRDEHFLQLGKKAKLPLLKSILLTISARLFEREVTISNLLLVKVRPYHLYHGAFFIQGKPGSVLYFEDIGMGLACVCTSLKTHHTSFMRFSSMDFENEPDEDELPLMIQPSPARKIIQ